MPACKLHIYFIKPFSVLTLNIIMAYVVLLALFIQSVLCDTGDFVMLQQPVDMRSVPVPVMAQFPTGHFVPHPAHLQPVHPPQRERDPDSQNFSLNEFIEAFNEAPQDGETAVDDQVRAAGRDEAYSYSHPPSYPYPASPSYPNPPLYHKPTYAPPANVSPPKIPLIKPGLIDLVKPVASKVQSKVNGLLGLVLALLTGSVPEGLELKGIKELLINSILKPLLVAKSGIKSLIGKLVIPVLALLLINVEVLVVVWWLWDECPTKTPTYAYKPPAEYSSYR